MWVGAEGIVVGQRGDWKGGVGNWGRFAHGFGCIPVQDPGGVEDDTSTVPGLRHSVTQFVDDTTLDLS